MVEGIDGDQRKVIFELWRCCPVREGASKFLWFPGEGVSSVERGTSSQGKATQQWRQDLGS